MQKREYILAVKIHLTIFALIFRSRDKNFREFPPNLCKNSRLYIKSNF